MPNQLRFDPSRSITLRKQFTTDFRKRLKNISKAVTQFIDINDSFGLKPKKNPLKLLAAEYAYMTDPQKIEQFKTWLDMQVQAQLLSPVGGIEGKPWTATYIDSAYRKGLIRAYTDVHAEALAETPDFYTGSKEQFLRTAFSQPEMLSKIKLLEMRAFEGMKGLTDTMKTQLNFHLAQGLSRGDNPYTIAREMRKTIAGMSKVRAARIARTEIIHAHAEGQLDSFQLLGVEEVGVMAEWSTAGDDLVCPMCGPLEGVVMEVKEARGLIPRHPNCRCAWLPANVGEELSKKDQFKFGPNNEFTGGIQRLAGPSRTSARWAGRNLRKGKI